MIGKLKVLRLNQFFSASILMIFGNNVINLFNYLYHFVMGRMLGPSAYGELATLISVVGLLLIIPSAFSLAVTRLVATGSDDPKVKQILNWVIKRTLYVSIGISLIFCFLSPSITSYLKITNNLFVIMIGVFFTFSMLAYIYKSILQGLLRFGSLIMTTVAETFSKLILGAAFVYVGYGVFGALGAILLSAILALIISKKLIGNFLKTKTTKEVKTDNLKELFMYSVPVTIYTIAQTSLFSADLILVKHFFPGFEAGLYAALSSLGKIIIFGAGPIILVMFPMISQRYSKNENYIKIFLLSLIFTILVCLSILALYYFIPEFVINASVGPHYLQASGILFLFGIFISLISVSNLLINFMLSLKRTGVVVLPAIAAVAQIALINYFHSSLLEVIYTSIGVGLSLLVSLVIFTLIKKND